MRRYDYTDGQAHEPRKPPIEVDPWLPLWKAVTLLLRDRWRSRRGAA